jgi:chromosome segregation ATPase
MSTDRRLPTDSFAPPLTTEPASAAPRPLIRPATPTDSLASMDGDSFEIADALQQIQGREQKLRRQLKDAQAAQARLEETVTSERSTTSSRIRTLEEELRLAREALSVRESQVKALTANRTQQVARDGEEKRYLREQLEQTQQKHEQLVRQYDELYQYCESLLKQAEQRRVTMESQLQKAMAANRAFEQHYKKNEAQLAAANRAQQESAGARAVLEQEVIRLRADHRRESEALKKAADDARASLDFASKNSSRAKFENRQVGARLEQLEQALTGSVSAGDRTRDGLAKSSRTLSELQRSIRNFFETPAEHGISPVRMKAGRLMAEQMRLEVETLRRLEQSLGRMMDSVSSALPGAETTPEKAENT